MIIYHGSDTVVDNPVILTSNRFLDFGNGFYTTSNKEQAISWAKRVCYRNQKEIGYVSVFEFDLEKAKKELNFREFSLVADYEWLKFVLDCRKGIEHSYDLVVGPIADDNVYSTIKNFEPDYTILNIQ